MQQPNLFDDPRGPAPVDPHVAAADKPRLAGKALAVLEVLKRKPATNVELVAVGGLRASARIHDLRKHGYRIDAESVGNGIWLYTLKGNK
jgi:hypothetical protein